MPLWSSVIGVTVRVKVRTPEKRSNGKRAPLCSALYTHPVPEPGSAQIAGITCTEPVIGKPAYTGFAPLPIVDMGRDGQSLLQSRVLSCHTPTAAAMLRSASRKFRTRISQGAQPLFIRVTFAIMAVCLISRRRISSRAARTPCPSWSTASASLRKKTIAHALHLVFCQSAH